jgi:Flp pilus assembly protein TadG
MKTAGRIVTTLWHSEGGGILTIWAILLPVVVGMMGVGLETGTWYLDKRNLQAAADAAAISAAYETTTAGRTSAAQSSVSANGYASGSGVTVSMNNPPLTGTYTSNTNAVEIILTRSQNRLFSSLFLSSNPSVKARSVALATITSSAACILALKTSGDNAVYINGSTSVYTPNCSIAANSDHREAIYINGNAAVNVLTLYTRGNYRLNGGSTLTTSQSPTVNGTSSVSDPYSGVNLPSIGSCGYNNYLANSGASVTLNPGVYCNGFTINGGATAHLNPGVYIMDRGAFLINGGSTLTGTNATIILTSSTGSNHATATINGNSTVTLSAPTSGTYSGIAFYQDRGAQAGNDNLFNGGSTMNITGALYFPRGDITFNGGNSTSSPACSQVIGYTVYFNGNSNLTDNCPSAGMQTMTLPTGATTVRLKE